MIQPESDTFLSPDEAAKDSLFHPVLLTLIEDNGFVGFTGIATIEFKRGTPSTALPCRLVPTPDDRYIMTLVGRSRAELVENLSDFALWTPNYAEFFDLEAKHPVLLLDAFEQ